MAPRRRLWTTVAVLLLLAACDATPRPKPPEKTSASPEAVAACSHASATARTDRGAPVGGPLAPAIGPLSFHAYEHTQGYPTKFIIHVHKEHSEAISLSGSRCSDGRTLRFLYDERGMLPGPLPKTEEQMLTTGDETAVLPPAGAGLDYTGYMLFSSKGRWQVTVTQSGAQLGVLLVEVA